MPVTTFFSTISSSSQISVPGGSSAPLSTAHRRRRSSSARRSARRAPWRARPSASAAPWRRARPFPASPHRRPSPAAAPSARCAGRSCRRRRRRCRCRSDRRSIAAAIATALVSEPPRPSVVMRLSGPIALEAGDDRDLPLARAARSARSPSMSCDARRAVAAVGADRDLPALPGARLDADVLQGDRQQPGRHLLAGGDHRVVFAGIVERRGLRASRRPAGWSCRPWPRPPPRPGGRHRPRA